MSNLPEFSESHLLEEESFRKLYDSLPKEHLYMRQETGVDLGVDRQIEAFVGGKGTNCRAHVQVKGLVRGSLNADGSISKSIKTSNLNYLMKSTCPVYVLYARDRDELRIAYAVDEKQRLDKEKPNWASAKNFTIRFSTILAGDEWNRLHKRILEESSFLENGRAGQTNTLISKAPIAQSTLVDVKPIFRLLARRIVDLCNQGSYSLARRDIAESGQSIPGDEAETERENLRAFVFRREGNFAEALEKYKSLYEQTGDSRFLLARITTLCAQSKWTEANTEFERLPDDARQVQLHFLVEANLKYQAGQYSDVLKMVTEDNHQRLGRTIYSSDYWPLLASVYQKLDLIPQALRASLRAVRANRPYPALQLALTSQILCRQGELSGERSPYILAIKLIEKARVQFTELLLPDRKDQEEFLSYMETIYATALLGSGEPDKAHKLLEDFAERHAVDDVFRYNMALFSKESVSVETTRNALKIVDNPSLWLNIITAQLVDVMNSQADSTQVQQDINEFALRYPDDPALDYFRGGLALGIGDVDRAVKLFDVALKNPRASLVTRLNSVDWSYIAFVNSDRTEEAEAILNYAIENNLENADLVGYVAHYYLWRSPLFAPERWNRVKIVAALLPQCIPKEQTRGVRYRHNFFRVLGDRIYSVALQAKRIDEATPFLDSLAARLPEELKDEFQLGMHEAMVRDLKVQS